MSVWSNQQASNQPTSNQQSQASFDFENDPVGQWNDLFPRTQSTTYLVKIGKSGHVQKGQETIVVDILQRKDLA